ncbi:CoA transferase [Maritimibacter alexandrii]|uniref:CoA transferase n=1 Tax=Maritimibacter alexandrii TaxID=2570355 RepID=UPI001C96A02A|nr:CoA transferase [Maritimibacter alexandrii]MBY5974595.1 CoA transferase [Ferrimonas balearica]
MLNRNGPLKGVRFIEMAGIAPAAQSALREALTDLFLSRTQAEWYDVLVGRDACFAPVVPLADAAVHLHSRAHESVLTVDGIEMPAPAPRFSHTRPYIPTSGDAGFVETNEILQHWRAAI